MKNIFLAIIIIMFVVSSIQCSEDLISYDKNFEGITETDAISPAPIGMVDKSDWKLRYDYFSSDSDFVSMSVLPAFPNPTERYATLRYSIPSKELIEIWIEDKFGNKELILNDYVLAGQFDIQVDLLYDQHGRKRIAGIYRLFFKVSTKDEIPLIKGDIQLL